MCPIPLPTVQSAYTIIWEQIEDSTPIIITNDSNRFMLSLDNQTLSIQISNSTDQMVFQCKLKLRQCSPLDPRRCQVVDVEGPFMEINVLGEPRAKLKCVCLCVCVCVGGGGGGGGGGRGGLLHWISTE